MARPTAPAASNNTAPAPGGVVERGRLVTGGGSRGGKPGGSLSIAGRRNKAASGGQEGASVSPIYGTRSPMTYVIFDTEFDSITRLNSAALTRFSLGSFFLSMLISIWLSWIFADAPEATEIQRLFLIYGTVIFSFLTVIFYVFGTWALITRKNEQDKIKNEHAHIATIRG
jgi:hypothetical protein